MQPESTPHPPARRWPRWLLGLGLFVGVMLVVMHRPRPGIDRRLAQLKAWGYPTTAADLVQWVPRVEDPDNLCLTVLDAVDALRVPKAGNIPLLTSTRVELVRGEPWSAEVLTDTRKFVADNATVFGHLPELVRRRQGRHELDYRQGPNLLLPHLAKYKSLTQALAVKAVFEAEEGWPGAAMEAIQGALATARSLEDEPLLISQLVRSAMLSITARHLELVLNRVQPDDAALAAVQQELWRCSSRSRLDLALVGELCSASTIFASSPRELVGLATPSGSPVDMRVSVALSVYRALGLLEADREEYVERLGRLIEVARMNPWERWEPVKTWEAQLVELRSKWYRARFLTGMLLPALANAAEKDNSMLATARCASVGVAIERFRRAQGGQPPEQLAALVPTWLPEIPIDPMDGQPLRYERRDEGYVVYSLGRDRDNDHGRERVRNQGNDDHDITFILER